MLAFGHLNQKRNAGDFFSRRKTDNRRCFIPRWRILLNSAGIFQGDLEEESKESSVVFSEFRRFSLWYITTSLYNKWWLHFHLRPTFDKMASSFVILTIKRGQIQKGRKITANAGIPFDSQILHNKHFPEDNSYSSQSSGLLSLYNIDFFSLEQKWVYP